MKTTIKILVSSIAIAAVLAASFKGNATENPGLKGTAASRELQFIIKGFGSDIRPPLPPLPPVSQRPAVFVASNTNFKPTAAQALAQVGTVKAAFTPTSTQALSQVGTVKAVFTPTSAQALSQVGTVKPVFVPTPATVQGLVSAQADAISPFIP
jgi:hypothetical protein